MTIEYELITSRKNTAVCEAAALLEKKHRESRRSFRFDGIKLFLEAVSAGLEIETIFIKESEKDKIISTISEAYAKNGRSFSGRALVLADFVFEKVTEEKGSQGIVCVVKYIDALHTYLDADDDISADCKKVMALCSVRDPGNIGTLLRSAAAFGIDTLVFSADCADIYNPKTVRASMGALFRQRIYAARDLSATLARMSEGGRRILAAEPDAAAVSISEIGLAASDCIVIGNEGHGISHDVLAVCEKSVFIPISSSTESLNASIAGAICMWEMSKL